MSAFLDLASWLLLVVGGLACAIGGLGMLRMPDFYTRIHAASVSDAVGAGLILAGLLLQAGSVLVALKLVVVGLLIFFTSPAATHALARAARHRGLEPWKRP
jgi:multicomponent Na+:H+ antiporter subunit G